MFQDDLQKGFYYTRPISLDANDQKLITQHLTTIQELQKQYEDLMGDLQVAAWANLDLESKVKYLKDDAKTDTQQRLKSVAINHTLHEVIRTIIQTYHKD